MSELPHPLGSLNLAGGGPPPPLDKVPLVSSAGGGADADADAEASPQLVHRGADGTVVYRSRDVGIKVVVGPDSSGERALRLAREKRTSDFLPRTCHKREVIAVSELNGQLALSFKWVEGFTLGEWLQQRHQGLRASNDNRVDSLNDLLGVAVAISRTLSEFHDGGVAHGALAPENIIMTSLRGECSATLIDLSSAAIFGTDGGDAGGLGDASEKQSLIDADLESLGSVLSALFWRIDEDTLVAGGELAVALPNEAIASTENEENDGWKRRKHNNPPLREGLPLSLGSLISTLCDGASPASQGQRYETAKDVLLDLKAMADKPDIYLRKTELDEWAVKSRLRLHGSGKFYGQQVQMSMVLHLFQSSILLGDRPLMAMISGPPGAGKSTLVNQIKKPLTEKNGYFIEGKFNNSVRPDTILASALNSFFGNVVTADYAVKDNPRNAHTSMKRRIRDAIGCKGDNVLLEVLPNLRAWMTEDEGEFTAAPRSSGKEMGSSHRLKYMFCKLLGAISCRGNPLILFLDDLQWADEMTLEIIQLTMTDPNIHHFLFLGCYRDNEVSPTHPLAKKLGDIQEKGMGISIVTINVGPMEKESLHALVADLLSLPPSLCRPLAMAVRNKTGGIIMFFLRFLSSLTEDGELRFSMSSGRWMYDLKAITQKEVHEDVVSHMTQQMTCLPKRMQEGLRVAACLGPNFAAKTLKMANKVSEVDNSFLQSCVEFDFLRSIGPEQYVWSHDQIKQAAYDLIPHSRRESFHLLVGSRIYMMSQSNTLEELLFVIVDNMNCGSRPINNQDLKYDLSELNLKAGEKALASGAFHTGASYFLAGLSLLDPDSWSNKYNLTMQLYDAASKALYLIGDFSGLMTLTEQPIMNARSFEDKLKIYNNSVRALSASLELDKGIMAVIYILAQLGIDIPMNVNSDVMRDELSQTAMLLSGKSQEDLISLPIMSETHKLAAMQFMDHAITMTYIAKPLLNSIFVFRMVRMTVEFGVCNFSCFAFACYGAVLVAEPICDVEGGYGMGRVATAMLKRLGAKEMTARLYTIVYSFVSIWKEPRQTCLSKHLESFEIGMEMGDIEFGLMSLNQYANTAIYGCGENLESLSQLLEVYTLRAYQFSQKITWKTMLVFHQLALDLRGNGGNAFSRYSSEVIEESLFESTRSDNDTAISGLICNKRKYLAFLTGDLETASEMYHLSHEFAIGSTGIMMNVTMKSLIDGLIRFYFARKHRDNEAMWSQVGQDSMLKMRKWSNYSDWNFLNKLHLLEAEDAFYRGHDDQAITCYEASIRTARAHGFVHEEGLAEEKAATFFLCKGRCGDAMPHFINAKKCYKVWGAGTLVRRIDVVIEELLLLCTEADRAIYVEMLSSI